MSGFPDFDFASTRYPGVLQRIGLVYFPASVIALHTKARGQVIAVLALLFGYWALMTLVPVLGFGPGKSKP